MCQRDFFETSWFNWAKAPKASQCVKRKALAVWVEKIYELPALKVLARFAARREKLLIELFIDRRISVIHHFSMKSTAFLTIIMTINWIFEIISFYAETSSTLFDIINALQGVLIFLMFVCLPRPLKLIGKWWNDRGSFQVLDNNFEKPSNDIQMTALCKQ